MHRHLENIEHHCKFSNREFHKAELQRLLKNILTTHNTKKEQEGQ